MSWLSEAWNDVTGQSAADDAAKNVKNASDKSIALQREMWQTGRDDLAPYRQAGVNALNQMQAFRPASFNIGDFNFQADPGYQFRMDQGLGAVDKMAGANLMRNSGRTLKALNDYAQGMASNEYGNAYNRWYQRRADDYSRTMGESGDRWNRLAQLSGLGSGATNQAVQAGQNAANSISQQYGNIGQANAAASMQGYNGLVNLANLGARAYGAM